MKISKRSNSQAWFYIIFAALIFISVFLRVYQIGNESFGVDELVTYKEVQVSSASELMNSVRNSEVIPPVYPFVIRAWADVFGNSLISLRTFSAIFSFLTVIFVFLVSKMIFGKKMVSLLPMLFAGTFISEIVLAQEARFYAFFGFLVLVSFYTFFKFVKDEKHKRRYVLCLSLLNLLLLYTNYLAIMVFFIQYIILIHFFKTKDNEQLWLKSLLWCAILALPSFWLHYLQFIDAYPTKVLQFTDIGVSSAFAPFLATIFYSMDIIISFFLLISLYCYRKAGRIINLARIRIPDIALFSVSIAFIVLILLSKEYLTKSFFLIRYIMFTAFLMYIIAAYILTRMNNKKIAGIIIGLFLVSNALLLFEFYSKPQKMEWQKAIEYMNPEKDDVFVFSKGGYYTIAFDYYTGNAYNVIELMWSEERIKKIITTEELKDRLSAVESFWLAAPRMKGKPIAQKEVIEKLYSQTDYKTFKNLEIYRYKHKP